MVNLKYNDWGDSYFSTATGDDRNENSTNYGLRAWWRPEDSGTAMPSISLGYDTSKTDADDNNSTNAYFVGLNWQDIFSADDRIGVALGQPQKHEDNPPSRKIIMFETSQKVNATWSKIFVFDNIYNDNIHWRIRAVPNVSNIDFFVKC